MNPTRPSFGGVLVAAAALAAAASGCLDPNLGSNSGTVGGVPDAAADAAAADVSPPEPDLVLQVEVQDPPPPPPSCPFTCSDGNECTDDLCDESTGECYHVPRSNGGACDGECGICLDGQCVAGATGYPNECLDGCDDGDQCTMDVCACEDDGCGNEHCWCEHVQSPSSACSDPPPPLGVCDPEGAIGVSDAVYTKTSGDFVKISGTAGMSWYASCDDSECGDCYGGLALTDANEQIVLDTSTDEDAPWICEVGGCPEVGSCSPLHHGAEYYAWGTLHYYSPWGAPEPDPGNAIVALEYQLDVQGWCLKDISGQYEGVISHDHGFQMPVTLTISKDAEGAYLYAMNALQVCDTCVQHPSQTGTVSVTAEGQLAFEANVPTWDYVAAAAFLVISEKHGLSGDFVDNGLVSFAGAEQPDPGNGDWAYVPSGGSISVQRVQNP